jgi:hypothetical protein
LLGSVLSLIMTTIACWGRVPLPWFLLDKLSVVARLVPVIRTVPIEVRRRYERKGGTNRKTY